MRPSRKALVVLLIIGLGLFGYSQYVAAYQIDVKVTDSELIEQDVEGATYNIQLEFENPSLLILNAGETAFEIFVEDEKIADGVLEPFVLPSMSKVAVKGMYLTDDNAGFYEEDKDSSVKISGVTTYEVFFASLEIPFIFFPSEEQARDFIHQN